MFLEECEHVLKEKKMPEYITATQKFRLILIEKILMKKNLMKKVKYRMCLVTIFLMSQMKILYLEHFK